MPRLTLQEENNRIRAEMGLPPLPVKTIERKRQKNPHRLKIAPRPAEAIAKPAIESPATAQRAIEKAATAAPLPPAIAIIAGTKWIGLPTDLLDNILETLQPTDQVVLIRLYRLTWGFKRAECKVSAAALAKSCNISKRQVQVSVSRLEAKGLILQLPTARTETAKFRMLLPPAIAIKSIAENATAVSADIKEKALIDKTEKSERMSPEELAAVISELESK